VKLSKEQVMVAKGMQDRGTSVRQMAHQLGVTEGALRYRLKRLEEPEQKDGRSRQPTALDGYEAALEALQERLGVADPVSWTSGRPNHAAKRVSS
jgi:transposase